MSGFRGCLPPPPPSNIKSIRVLAAQNKQKLFTPQPIVNSNDRNNDHNNKQLWLNMVEI